MIAASGPYQCSMVVVPRLDVVPGVRFLDAGVVHHRIPCFFASSIIAAIRSRSMV